MRLSGPRGALLSPPLQDPSSSALALMTLDDALALMTVQSSEMEMDTDDTLGTPRSVGSENGAVSYAGGTGKEMLENTEAMLEEVKDLPSAGNAVSILALELRSVLDRNELILDEHTREKAAQ